MLQGMECLIYGFLLQFLCPYQGAAPSRPPLEAGSTPNQNVASLKLDAWFLTNDSFIPSNRRALTYSHKVSWLFWAFFVVGSTWIQSVVMNRFLSASYDKSHTDPSERYDLHKLDSKRWFNK